MGKDKKVLICIFAYLLVCVVLFFVNGFFNTETTIYKVFNYLDIVLISILIIAIITFVVLTFNYLSKDRKIIEKAVKDKDFDEAIAIFEEKANKYFLGRLIKDAKHNLLFLYFLSGQIENSARLLKETSWGIYKKSTYYFSALIELYNDDINMANMYYEKLVGLNKKEFESQIKLLDRIFYCINNNNFEDKFYIGSKYPITEKIYELHSKKVLNV